MGQIRNSSGVTGYDQYWVKVDGSGRLTLRNCRFLCAYTPATPSIPQQSPALSLHAFNSNHVQL